LKNIDEISAKVEKRKQQLQPLFDKDKENYDLWSGTEQIFDTHKMAINITGTEMVALAIKTQASINRSRLDIHVLPPNPLPNPDAIKTANHEENMYYHGFGKADERLSMIGEVKLLPATSWQATVIGRIAVRILVYLDDETGEIVWDFLPLYPGSLTFEFDSKGLAWGCYETFPSAESIWNEYKVEVKDEQGKGISKSDYWDRDHNVRYLTEDKTRLGKVWKHPFKGVPIILQPVARAPKAIDSSGIQVTSWGESIFDHVKTGFRSLNKMRSITATHAHMIAKAPLDHAYEDGTNPVMTSETLDFYPGAMMSHPKSETVQSMKIADIPSSLMAIMGDISTGIKNATYAELNPDTSAHSGAALRILGQDKQDTETPIVGALNDMYTRICRMVKCQATTQGLTVPVRTVANKTYEVFDMVPELLDNDFYVNAELMRKDVYDEVEALQRAQMLLQLGLMSKKDVMERVILEQDVPSRIAEIDIEGVEAAIPELKLPDVILAYIEKKQYDKAKILLKQLALMDLQKQQGVPGMPGQPTGTPEGTPPVPQVPGG
jgi:hypothetical protein